MSAFQFLLTYNIMQYFYSFIFSRLNYYNTDNFDISRVTGTVVVVVVVTDTCIAPLSDMDPQRRC